MITRPSAAAVALLLLLLGRSALGAGHGVTFRAEDGRTLSGIMFEADSRPSAAVVLVPMLGRPKDDWQAVAQKLADASIGALAIDLPSQVLPEDPKSLAGWAADIRAAVAYLASRPDVRPSAIGLAGASLGANLAAVAAAADPRIHALALVSPSLDYRGVRIEAAMRQYGIRPALLLGSAHDPYAVRSMRQLASGAPGPRDMRWSDMTAHGTVMLAQDGDLVRGMVEWFQRTLAVN